MEINDIGLGSMPLFDKTGEKVTVRVSIDGDSLKFSLSREDEKSIEVYLEDETDISGMISILESCFDYV